MTFALDPVWPPMFRSRTCDPTDPCFMGRAGGQVNANSQPAQSAVAFFNGQVRWDDSPAETAAVRTLAARIVDVIKACGPLRTSALCIALGTCHSRFSRASLSLVDAGTLKVHKVGREKVYSLSAGVTT